MLPAETTLLAPDDELLFCSRSGAEALLRANMNNIYTLGYLVDGREPPRSSILARLLGKPTA